MLLQLLFCGLVWLTTGWRTSDLLPGHNTFKWYAGKFCFDYAEKKGEEAGKFTITVRGKVTPGTGAKRHTNAAPCWGECKTSGGLYLLVFDDEEDHWLQVRRDWGTVTCDSIEEMARYASLKYAISGLDGTVNRTVGILESVRPRFWYFTFVACEVDEVQNVEYELHAENIWQGSRAEFSLDENGKLGLEVLAALLFVSLSQVLRYHAKRATGAEALRSRPLSRLLQASATCSAVGACCLMLHYSVYATNGVGVVFLQMVGQLFVCLAKAWLAVLQLLTAKGWALFYAPEELGRRQFMICVLGGIVLITLVCEVHADYFHDMSTTLYLYESTPGYVILGLSMVLFLEAWRSMRETYHHETSEEVRVFYLLVSLASSMYFLTLPIMCFLAAVFDPWVRAYCVSVAEVCSRFLATVVMAICLRPSRLDAMVNARLEDGPETIGEMRDDISEEGSSDDSAGAGDSRARLLSGEKGGGWRGVTLAA